MGNIIVMPVLVTSAHSTLPEHSLKVTVYNEHGISAYSRVGTSHLADPGLTLNEDNFFVGIVLDSLVPDAASAKEMLRQLRDKGGQEAWEVRKTQGLQDACTTLAAAVTYGDWSTKGNPDARGFAVACPGDSGIAWRDKETGKVIQLTKAQETVIIKETEEGNKVRLNPITNFLGYNKLEGEMAGEIQDRRDQVMAFSEKELAAELQKHGINSVNGELIVFSDGIIQTARRSTVLNTPPEESERPTHQEIYDEETKQYQAEKIEELGRRHPTIMNKAFALVKAAEADGSHDDLTAITIQIPPLISDISGHRIAYLCDGAGGHAGGWQASNTAVLAAGELLRSMEQRHIAECIRRDDTHPYNQFDPYEVIASSVGAWKFENIGARIDSGRTPNFAMLRALTYAKIPFFDLNSSREHNHYIQVSGAGSESLRGMVDPGTILRATMGTWETVENKQGLSHHPDDDGHASYSSVVKALEFLGFRPDGNRVPAGTIHIPERGSIVQAPLTEIPNRPHNVRGSREDL